MVMFESSERFFPSVLPKVVIHTKTFDVCAPERTGMVLCPGLSGVAGTSREVSSSRPGDAVDEERISTLVPVLGVSMDTAPTTVGLGNCNINPTPFLKLGNGTASV